MFNYDNISDVDFEELAKDVLGRMLNTQLRSFRAGKDGGIDLTDNTSKKNIIVQVKHFRKSNFSALKSTLENSELPKVQKLNPEKYYVVCSKELSPQNTEVIYNIFKNYMESDKNIISLKEIEDFLQREENLDIVKKHYKLWYTSTEILADLISRDVFLDSDVLIHDIQENSKYFVQTAAFDACLHYLEHSRMLLITGAPGIGKTYTSQMLAMHFAREDYKIRYTTNGSISELKKAVSQKKESKELLFLDDCLGQYYLKMNDNQENELISLLKYIKMNPNKMIILNSRITIYNEARKRNKDFSVFLDNEKFGIHSVEINNLSVLEKAKMLFNHLYFKGVDAKFFDNVRERKNYLRIINHHNYSPRIIDYLTNKATYNHIKSSEYTNNIIKSLDNPTDIWENEFYRRLDEIDRLFMFELFSLTDTNIDYEILKECFEEGLKTVNNVDYTRRNCDEVLKRLNGSLVKIYSTEEKRMIGVLNPSINDFLLHQINGDKQIRRNIIDTAIYFDQLIKYYNDSELNNILHEKIEDESILNYSFLEKKEKYRYVASNIYKYKIANANYTESVHSYLKWYYDDPRYPSRKKEKYDIISLLMQEPFFSKYELLTFFSDLENLEIFLRSLSQEVFLHSISLLVNVINNYDLSEETKEGMIDIISDQYIYNVEMNYNGIDATDYIDDFDMDEVVYDLDNDIDYLSNEAEKELYTRLELEYNQLPDLIRDNIPFESLEVSIDNSNIKSALEEHFNDYSYEEYVFSKLDEEHSDSIKLTADREIEMMFIDRNYASD